MVAGVCLRIMLIAVGVVILGVTTVSLAKKHMTESFCLFWGLTSVLFIAAGILLQPMGWNRIMSWSALIIIFFGILCILIAGFYFSVRISRLMRQVTELAIQISLLNQENEMLLRQVSKHEEELSMAESGINGHEKENTVHN